MYKQLVCSETLCSCFYIKNLFINVDFMFYFFIFLLIYDTVSVLLSSLWFLGSLDLSARAIAEKK